MARPPRKLLRLLLSVGGWFGVFKLPWVRAYRDTRNLITAGALRRAARGGTTRLGVTTERQRLCGRKYTHVWAREHVCVGGPSGWIAGNCIYKILEEGAGGTFARTERKFSVEVIYTYTHTHTNWTSELARSKGDWSQQPIPMIWEMYIYIYIPRYLVFIIFLRRADIYLSSP